VAQIYAGTSIKAAIREYTEAVLTLRINVTIQENAIEYNIFKILEILWK
jgi:hypothetical protein